MLLARPPDLAPRAPWPDMPLVVWPAALAMWGPGDASSRHAHHAMHLLLRREGTLTFRAGTTKVDSRAAGVLVGPDVPHAIDATGGEVILLFVEPESQDGERLRASLDSPARLFDEAARDALLARLPRKGPIAHEAIGPWMEATLEALAGPTEVPAPRMHPRVRKLLRHLRAEPAPEDTSLEALSEVAGLSSGRLMHAFTESTGVPLRPYLLWLRLQRAAGALASGRTAGEAAHAAGFSDAAHLTRTFRRMFGTTPSFLQRRSQFVQAKARPTDAS
ncbi:helix-turn-helix transcriptional regulator [Myxococcus llanfairpwllgwyngyllgogerychwyrndrobwllllantysiliogogogochensis]|uniref:Helix-turn-helix transcriptional regulator n=2 Tax=Myxococcus llanfairpwllgwyngyllgogerychwyrndrobwllllantysiliogogogochensis TaxID=2590453 RepID=A0A540XAW5_9BACT|nr:helix-turn-helix transcriptional regulator [Myxococcus llanfairpwllgwyngyllgogerychwyrndrobwllllantysiliogogogochensis]